MRDGGGAPRGARGAVPRAGGDARKGDGGAPKRGDPVVDGPPRWLGGLGGLVTRDRGPRRGVRPPQGVPPALLFVAPPHVLEVRAVAGPALGPRHALQPRHGLMSARGGFFCPARSRLLAGRVRLLHARAQLGLLRLQLLKLRRPARSGRAAQGQRLLAVRPGGRLSAQLALRVAVEACPGGDARGVARVPHRRVRDLVARCVGGWGGWVGGWSGGRVSGAGRRAARGG